MDSLVEGNIDPRFDEEFALRNGILSLTLY